MNGKKNGFFLSSTLFLLLRYIPVYVFVVCACVDVDVSLFSFIEGHTQMLATSNERYKKRKKEKAEEKSMQRGRNNRDRNHT